VCSVHAWWKACCVLCCTVLYIRLVCTWEVDTVPFTLQYHLSIKGGRCVSCSAVPYNSLVCALCKCAFMAEGLTRTLQYRLFYFSGHGRWTACQQLCNTCTVLCMEGGGVSSTLLLCSTAFAWTLEGVSPTLQNRLWMEGGKGVNNCAIQSLHGRWEVCVTYSATPSLYGWWKGCPRALQYSLWIEG
jgi:hypothetical protein